MGTQRPKRTLAKEEKQYLLDLAPDDITLSKLQEMFADTYDRKNKKRKPSKFNTYDEFKLEKGEYFNKESILTNCGLFIINKFLFEKDLQDVIGYVNEPFSDDVIGSIYSKMDTALMEDHITPEVYIEFLDRLCWIAFSINTEICTSLTIHSMKELPEVKREKDRLIKENKDAFKTGQVDISTVTKIESQLVATAKKSMASDDAMELYESGARGSFNVAYKNSQIMKGPVFNSATGEWEVVTSGLAQGISKSDVPSLANSMIDSAYSKSIAPGECGYLTKKLYAAFQGASLDKKDSDCGTKMYAEVLLDDDAFKFYKYNYMVIGSNLVRLDDASYAKHKGKVVKMRTVDFCCGKKICNKCAGDRYYLLGIENVGLTSPKLSNAMLNARFKVFHDTTVKTYGITQEDFM